jgi:hypothetical protein
MGSITGASGAANSKTKIRQDNANFTLSFICIDLTILLKALHAYGLNRIALVLEEKYSNLSKFISTKYLISQMFRPQWYLLSIPPKAWEGFCNVYWWGGGWGAA